MRQKIARLIHDVDGDFAIGNSAWNVQPKIKIGARELLHVLDDLADSARLR